MKLDPRTQLLIIIIAGSGMLLLSDLYFFILLGVTFVYYLLNKGQKLAFYLFYALVLYVINYSIYRWGGETTIVAFGLFARILFRFIPVMMIARILSECSPGKFMESLRRMKAPQSLIISLSVAIRFLPDVRQQIRDIIKAAKIRGLQFSLFRPLYSFELVLVPVLHRSLKVADELSAAIITKGVEFEGPKTSYHELSFGVADFVMIATYTLIVAGAIWLN